MTARSGTPTETEEQIALKRNRLVLEQARAVGLLDVNAEACRTWIAPRASVDIRDHAHVVAWVAVGAGTK